MRKNIKPVQSKSVLNPETGSPVPVEGAAVIWGTYWERRVLDGSIEIVKIEKPKGKEK